jgi:RNA polymerase sigma factor for flagellar operon FliA
VSVRTDPPEVVERVKEGLDIVEHLARQLRRQLGPYARHDELVSQGRETLLLAARSWDASRGVPFRLWANLRVRGAMIDAMRAQGNLPRRVYAQLRAMQAADRVHEAADEEDAAARPASPEAADERISERLAAAATAMALGFVSYRPGDQLDAIPASAADPEQTAGHAEMMEAVRAAIAERPEAERKLLERHYFEDAQFDAVAGELGISKAWASRLHARAIEGVARALKRARVAR